MLISYLCLRSISSGEPVGDCIELSGIACMLLVNRNDGLKSKVRVGEGKEDLSSG